MRYMINQQGGNPYCTLPAGYLGSSAIGAVLVMCGFNILASKIASIFLGTCLLLTLWWAKNWLTRGIGIAFIAIMVFLWWLAHGVGLKYFVLFIGYVNAVLLAIIFFLVEMLTCVSIESCLASTVCGIFWMTWYSAKRTNRTLHGSPSSVDPPVSLVRLGVLCGS